jgi:hypothetical protein
MINFVKCISINLLLIFIFGDDHGDHLKSRWMVS